MAKGRFTKNSLQELNGKPARNCCTCGKLKDLATGFRKIKGQLYGYSPNCEECLYTKNITNLGHFKHSLQKNFGLTIEDYNKLLSSQDNVCAICKKTCITYDHLTIDHNHETDEVRGLLCRNCNLAIGLLEENEDIIWNMMEYLKKTTWVKQEKVS